MGGSALKKETCRLSSNEFYKYREEVSNILKNRYDYFKFVESYKNKESFGDLDILVSGSKESNLLGFIKDKFNNDDIFINGNIVSFDYKNFQIDLILLKKEIIPIAEFYFNIDPLGNLLGKIFHSFGLKFSWNIGLSYPLRTEHGNVSDEIFLTDDPEKILDFIGLSYNVYLRGFNDLEDVFKFVVSSKYFNIDKYLINDEKSHIDRRREGRRPSILKFIDWLEKHKNEIQSYIPEKDKTKYNQMIFDYFPESNFLLKIEEFNKKQEMIKQVSLKFNGQIIMKLVPELKGKELGEFIRMFKSWITGNNVIDFNEIILSHSQEFINNKILNYYKILHL